MAARRLHSASTARVTGAGQYEWVLNSNVADIDAIVEQLVAACRTAGFSGKQCRLNVPVAITEALSNAMLRGNCGERSRKVRVAARIDTQALVVEVTDEGTGFDVAARQCCPDDEDWLDKENGRGLFLMRALMDEVQYRREAPPARGHTVQLKLRKA